METFLSSLIVNKTPNQPRDGSKMGGCVCACESLSHVQLFVTPWTVACQTPLSVQFCVCVCVQVCLLVAELCVSVSCSVASVSAAPWTVAHEAPLFMEFSRREYWSELPFPSTGTLPIQGSKPGLLH